MRKLNRKQELMIQDYYNNNPGMAFIDDSLISKIENINDYETLIDDINRYYDDLKCNTKKEKQYNELEKLWKAYYISQKCTVCNNWFTGFNQIYK